MVEREDCLPLVVLRPSHTHHSKYASWPDTNKSNNKKMLSAVNFLLGVGEVNIRASMKGPRLSWETSLTHELGTCFFPDLGSFFWKKESWRFRERVEFLLYGSENADWDVTDPAIQLHRDWSGKHLPQGADWAFLGLKLLCQINFICCLNNDRVLNFGKNQNGNSGWRG